MDESNDDVDEWVGKLIKKIMSEGDSVGGSIRISIKGIPGGIGLNFGLVRILWIGEYNNIFELLLCNLSKIACCNDGALSFPL